MAQASKIEVLGFEESQSIIFGSLSQKHQSLLFLRGLQNGQLKFPQHDVTKTTLRPGIALVPEAPWDQMDAFEWNR